MKVEFFFSLLLSLFFLASCQVKEKTGTGLISGHLPSSNSFTIETPTADTYITGDALSITLSFPWEVTVTGTPQLNLTIGSTTRYANYASGSGSKNLVFTYTIVAADNDSNGVTLNSLGLNGGTLQFSNNGTITNCDITTVSSTTFTSVLVDNSGPTIVSNTLTTVPGFYHVGDTLTFSVVFSEAVYVTGTPRFSMSVATGGPVWVNYAGGTGTSTLSFTYTLPNTVADTNGINAVTSPIQLNSGTIKDAAGNDSSLTFTATYSSLVLFDGRLPYVVSVTPPSDGTYVAAQALNVTLEFDRAVTVTGSPYIVLTIGSNSRQAAYVSGSGTTNLLFRYTTIPGDVDTDGITVASTVTQNSGTITGTASPTNSFFVTGNNSYTVPSTTGIIINSVQPTVTAISRNVDSTLPTWGAATADNKWIIDQDFLITATFNTNVYVNQTSGTPRIPITVGSTTRYATYLSGGDGQTSLVFRYVIQDGDSDTDGSIAVGSIDLNGGTITDIANTNSLLTLPSSSITSTTIDGVRPTISSIAAPSDGTYSNITGSPSMNFTVTWSEAVNYSSSVFNIPLTIGATAVNAPYISGNNTTTIIHRPTISAGYNDLDGITLTSPMSGTAVIKDQAGNTGTVFTYTPPTTTGVLVDTTAPTIISVTPPAADTYNVGENLDFVVTFSEIVNVNSSGGYPRISLAFDSGTKYATYLSGSGTTTITFRYTVVTGDSDLTGITAPTAVNITAPAYIRDLGWNGYVSSGSTSYSMTTSLTGVIVDALAATVSSVTKPTSGTYTSGDNLQFTLTYSEAVNITGTPSINVTAQTGTLNFDYVSGTGTTSIVFRYTAGSTDLDLDGLSSVSSITLNGGTIQDNQGTDAATTFTSQTLTTVLIAPPSTAVISAYPFSSNSAVSGSPTISRSGSASTVMNASKTYLVFNGDDAINIGSTVSGVEHVFVVFRTDSTSANLPFISSFIDLSDNSGVFDITTAGNTSLNLDGSSYSSNTNHATAMSTSSFHLLHVDLSASSETIASGTLISSSFLGAVAEVIVVNGPLSSGQVLSVRSYLSTKYTLP